MDVQIGPLTPAHRAAAVALFVASHPERADEPADWDDASRWPRRFGSVTGSTLIGYGALWPVRPGKFRLDLVVASERRRRGVGGRILERLTADALASGALTLQARADDDRGESLAFLRHRKFAETIRMHRFALDIARANLEPFAGVERRLVSEGIEFTTLDDELRRRGEACWVDVCDVFNASREGWPDPDPSEAEPSTPDDVRRLHEQLSRRWPQPCLLAAQGEQYVGFAGPFGTGVRPAMRGRGIATALKVRAIAAARQRGESRLSSSSANPAMLRVLERLGYERTGTEVRLVRALHAGGGVA